jgi:hypothetical protein
MYRVSQNEEDMLMEKCQIPVVSPKFVEGSNILYYHITV